ncbi:MAG TPA: ATP-binding protein [Actinomycetota bacterium]
MITRNRDRLLLLVSGCLFLATFVIIGSFLSRSPVPFSLEWLLWSILIAGIELLPVPAWRGLTISVGFPVLIMVAILYPAGAAGLIAFIGALDPREFRREVSIGVALYNRSQVALSVVAASAVFHLFHAAAIPLTGSPAWILVGAAALSALADYAVNASLVTIYMSTKLGISAAEMFRQLTIGNVRDFLISYLGLGILGLTLAVFYQAVHLWALPAVLAPLIFARQMFFRSQALEEAHVELTEREEILRELSNTMAEERADERLQIAGYLHDDLAQVLFRLSLQVDIARKLLDKGDVDDVRQQLDKIRESKQETSDRIRALIRDLHRSPLGAKGLAESLESFTDEVGRDSDIRFHRDVQDIDLPAPIALLVFHIAREGIMNAVKHADPTDVSVSVAEQGEDIVLQLEDNGAGFDAGAPGPEGHYGMAMMRERAKVGGGSLDVRSGIGEGTTITVRFPIALLQREQQPGSEPPSANGPERASPGTPGTTSRSAEGSRDSVPA